MTAGFGWTSQECQKDWDRIVGVEKESVEFSEGLSQQTKATYLYIAPGSLTDYQRKMVDGAIAYGLIYCVMVFVAGLQVGKWHAVCGAIATAGVTYLSFSVQVSNVLPLVIVRATVGLSVVLGLVAGLLLLW